MPVLVVEAELAARRFARFCWFRCPLSNAQEPVLGVVRYTCHAKFCFVIASLPEEPLPCSAWCWRRLSVIGTPHVCMIVYVVTRWFWFGLSVVLVPGTLCPRSLVVVVVTFIRSKATGHTTILL